MNSDNKMQQKLKPYLQAMPDILYYQIATKALLAVWLFLLSRIFQALLISAGKVAVTSGDWQFLFTTWQGIFILLLGFVSLFLYVAFDLNATIVLCGDLLQGVQPRLERCIREGLGGIGRMLNLRGILVVVYIALIAPVLGVGISISLTKGLYIPTFISAFIEESVLYSALAGIAVLLFLSVGIANLLILHGLIIDKLPIGDASRQSRAFMKENWKDYLLQNILFILTLSVSLVAITVLCLFLPLKIIEILPLPLAISRFLSIFFMLAGVLISTLADLLGLPLYLLKMTQLYFSYKQGSEYEFRPIERDRKISPGKKVCIAVIVVIAVVVAVDVFFDQLFPPETNVKIIAHRAGGNEGPENTVAGLAAAEKLGAYGAEIDIQRTKDGAYVINHDSSFKRVAGDKRTPEEMTLKEVKKLSVDGEPVPTLEEMLVASKGKLVLFIELKGSTADKKMADDAVALIKKYKMEDEAALISLKYDLIDYIESTYPEIQTGFLTFASFGRTAELNCDYLGLEEESATVDTIASIHAEGKQVLVWTANSKGSQKLFLCTKVDGLITDNVAQAVRVAAELPQRSDIDRMVDKLKTIL